MSELTGPPKRKLPGDVKIPRTYMSKAYVEEPEPGTFLMYRDILQETDQPDGTGGFFREKWGKRIGPIMRLRLGRPGERPDFITSREDGTVLELVRTDRGESER